MQAASPDAGPLRAAESRVGSAFVRFGRFLKRIVIDAWELLRFLPFAGYVVLSILGFWLWLVEVFFSQVRFVMRLGMVLMLWLSGGVPPRPGRRDGVLEGAQDDVLLLWDQRFAAYEQLARPLARQYLALRRATRRFWYWTLTRKAFVVLLVGVFVGIPGMYIVPRPHYVQVTDDNATHYENDGTKVYYLVHAVDLFQRGKTREYENEDAWWLGKVNSQGLKSQLQPGKFYKFWVVGIRWYKAPILFPNIISATEVDQHGRPLENPSRLMTAPPPTVSGPPAP
ncbi:MAG: hypothetical protein AB7H88_05340 [Vicinamibacterales bacterium]